MPAHMMRRLSACLIVVAMVAVYPDALRAQERSPRVTLRADILLYGDNTEFRNPFREGETIFGSAVRVYGTARLNDAVDVSLGLVGNEHFGGEDAFDVARPLVRLTLRGGRSSFSMGTFTPRWESLMTAPDTSGPHGLLPPLQVETLTFTRPAEAGLQWTYDGKALQHEAWINWQRLNTREHRERFDTGAAGQIAMSPSVAVPFQVHVVHEGGQLYASGPVRDSTAAALGVRFARQAGVFERVSLESYALGSRDVPDRSDPRRSRSGAAFLGRAAAERGGWRGHVLFWRGDDFVKDEGDPNYQSIRRNGTRYAGIRDYAEAGLTRAFRPARGVTVAVSARLHRTERHYEYSYRVAGAVALDHRLK